VRFVGRASRVVSERADRSFVRRVHNRDAIDKLLKTDGGGYLIERNYGMEINGARRAEF